MKMGAKFWEEHVAASQRERIRRAHTQGGTDLPRNRFITGGESCRVPINRTRHSRPVNLLRCILRPVLHAKAVAHWSCRLACVLKCTNYPRQNGWRRSPEQYREYADASGL